MKTRALGYIETIYALVHDHANGLRNVGILSHIEGPLDVNRLRKAFHANHQRHPLLNARYSKSDDGKQYRFHLDVAFDDVDIQILPLNALQRARPEQLLEEVVSMPYDTGSSLWRARVYLSDDDSQQHFIVYGFHHSINDAYSVMCFTKDLLTYYQMLSEGKTFESKPLSVPSAIEKNGIKPCEYDDYIKAQTALYQKYPCKPDMDIHQWVVPEQSKQKVIFCDFDIKTLKKLQLVTKKYHIKMSALFNAAILLAFYRVTGQTAAPLHIAVNMRHLAEPQVSLDDFGCFVQSVRLAGTNLGQYQQTTDLASALQKQFNEQFNRSVMSVNSFDLERIEQVLKKSLSTIEDRFIAGPVISNWGNITLQKQYGDIRLKSIHRGNNQRAPLNPFTFLMATLNGEIYTTFNYAEPYMETVMMNEIVAEFRGLILEL